MVEAQVKVSVAVMAHPSRRKYADRLYAKLEQQKFYTYSLLYDTHNNEWDNGVAALRSHTDSDWHVVLQDDAIISGFFYENLIKAINNLPEETLVSFYTGRVRPFPTRVKPAVDLAVNQNASFIRYYALLWGVGFAIKTDDIETMLDAVRNETVPFDQRISKYYASNNVPVFYTVPSIVDHDFTIDSIANSDYIGEPRRAHIYDSGEVSFNNRDVQMW